MKAIIKLPGMAPAPFEIHNSLEALQSIVGGFVEVVRLEQDWAILCNEEGRLRGMRHNCKIRGISFCGPILIVGVDDDEFCDLDPEKIDYFMDALASATKAESKSAIHAACCR